MYIYIYTCVLQDWDTFFSIGFPIGNDMIRRSLTKEPIIDGHYISHQASPWIPMIQPFEKHPSIVLLTSYLMKDPHVQSNTPKTDRLGTWKWCGKHHLYYLYNPGNTGLSFWGYYITIYCEVKVYIYIVGPLDSIPKRIVYIYIVEPLDTIYIYTLLVP